MYRIRTDGTGNTRLGDTANVQWSMDVAAGWVFFEYGVPNAGGGYSLYTACVTADGEGYTELGY